MKHEKGTNNPILLAIESSCDDTSCAILKGDRLLVNLIANQKVHERYGGVVPELASRAHQQNIVPVVDDALKQSGINKNDLDAVAFTLGPGLAGSLLVGVSFAKAFAMALNKPFITVNHLHGHILSHFIKENNDTQVPKFPFICLLVSGGHTQIVLVKSPYNFEIVGNTIDDAAGEAFDKSAKMLDLGYPGGPVIDKLAQTGDPHRFAFAQPRIPDLNFSFSGLKTSILYFLRDNLKENPNFIKENINDLCASIQFNIVDILMKKLIKAVEKYDCKQVAISGGVSANSLMRNTLSAEGEKRNWKTFIPKLQFTTDNAAMVAIAALFKYQNNDFSDLSIAPFASVK
ncbi:MAG: tRNA (adenosine(37)-N6)-threonylcarbamoyltransferase complex transferase subunit TsaD [Bacteroidales bacterium]|jgi:N6-L-threonylcarbamoyladenine synthase|nr:tRNA (adenosine(37)-N6)-threonylcarbamoyltransferase complex transferase subunit TsaD [Bacteroidales bacterium]